MSIFRLGYISTRYFTASLSISIRFKSLVLEKNSKEDLSLFGQANMASNEMNLLSQQKSVDYFLIIENIVNKKYVDKVLKKISEISGVITSFVSENRLENKENLIFS